MNIHIERYGQGKPIVFFHGWGFDSQIWQSLIPLLNNYYELILVDLPGFGLTSIMDWHSFKKNLLLQLPSKFNLAGWSMGGSYAMRLAIEETERVIKLLSINSSPCFIADKDWPGVTKELFTTFYNNLLANIDKTLNDFVALQINKTKIDYIPRAKASIEGLDLGMVILETWDFREEIKNLDLPLCFMFGRLDPITPVKTMSAMRELYPQNRYILFSKAAHMPFLSHAELFIKELIEFIQ